ncbi:hypothetical protein ADL15_11815 [Actinoplanes awajinensis subsp. mycoplanecinus]|uniref:Uncharacterized protein n=1 Tax=Actinoplanes awajinensis subsp. mycoplanecinus TaxID=135947 RepID=A0A0X3UZG4_9ACTN|nr:hypothetical protein ADL15_11815 [Actinoplanes awajinensis subsp. mycoplanecinus]
MIANQLPLEELAGFEPVLRAVLEELRAEWDMQADIRRLLSRHYGAAIGRLHNDLVAHLFFDDDGFGPVARQQLGAATEDRAVVEVLDFAFTLAKPVPAKVWLRRAAELLSAGARAGAGDRAGASAGAGDRAGAGAGAGAGAVRVVLEAFAERGARVGDEHDVLLRGLCWLQGLDGSAESTALLGRVAEVACASRSARSADPKAPKAAAAVVEVLVDRSGDVPAAVLSRLSMSVRSRPVQKRVQAALERIADARGWAPGEAQELTVDDHGLKSCGCLRLRLRDSTDLVGVEILDDKAAVRVWRDGTPLKTVPTAMRAGLAPLRTLATQVTKTLASERGRLEALLAQDRTWAWTTWEQRYLRHPVTGSLARRLIWQVSPDNGQTWHSGFPAPTEDGTDWTVDGHSGAHCTVRLWHPVEAPPAEVAAWRDHVTAATTKQPFKQAFREVYRLTPAEVQTDAYSNRFAGHILRYRQANALMRVRGWSANYLGSWGDGRHGEATKDLAAGTWQATFHHEIATEGTGQRDRVEFCSTDQVRFARRDGRLWTPTRLDEVPPRLLSEAMRDVDLFVGVTSIAADETWNDSGAQDFRRYWRETAFGALPETAKVRRDALARILPALTIAPQCELTDRYLEVRGTRTLYKIHLGSANILMAPDDTYLCIVPAGRGPRVALPFNDDPRLSLILSKAFLLAADHKITDESILGQLPA